MTVLPYCPVRALRRGLAAGHPRVCHEHVGTEGTFSGTPVRGGTLRCGSRNNVRRRFIPARGGNTIFTTA